MKYYFKHLYALIIKITLNLDPAIYKRSIFRTYGSHLTFCIKTRLYNKGAQLLRRLYYLYTSWIYRIE